MTQTHMFRSLSLGAAALLATAATATAQGKPPAIRPLGPVVATSTETFGPVIALRHTPFGVLVNDGANRRVVMLDSTLSQSKIVADSLGANGNEYSGRQAGLIAYKGDSTLFIDPQSMSMVVLDAEGKSTRVMAVPRDPGMLGSVLGGTGHDGTGRLIYRGFPQLRMENRGGAGAPMGPPQMPDTFPIFRVDLATRALDTLGYVKMPRPRMDVNRDEATGRMSVSMTINPLPTVDDFTVLSDGSLAIVRGRDYHVDFIRPDGTKESAPKMPFDWRRLTDEDKVAFIDSLKAAREKFLASQPQAAQPGPPASSTTTTTPGGAQRTEMIVMGPGPMAAGGGGNPMQGMMNSRNANFVQPSELPDYQPPFFSTATRADMDGNAWIQTIPTKAYPGGPIYDVVNSRGELIDRVQIPKDRQIVGFGKNGVVYLSVREAGKTKLERAKLK
jgi:hypothetical protein